MNYDIRHIFVWHCRDCETNELSPLRLASLFFDNFTVRINFSNLTNIKSMIMLQEINIYAAGRRFFVDTNDAECAAFSSTTSFIRYEIGYICSHVDKSMSNFHHARCDSCDMRTRARARTLLYLHKRSCLTIQFKWQAFVIPPKSMLHWKGLSTFARNISSVRARSLSQLERCHECFRYVVQMENIHNVMRQLLHV